MYGPKRKKARNGIEMMKRKKSQYGYRNDEEKKKSWYG